MSDQALLQIEGLALTLGEGAGGVPVIVDATLQVRRGEVVGLVGESGSGKTMLARAIIGLLPDGAQVRASTFRFGNDDLLAIPRRRRQALRGRQIGMIFQDPMSSLHPMRRVGAQLEEMLSDRPAGDRRAAVEAALRDVALPDPARVARAYPHELSGGMRQRALIAMMLLGAPALLLADEPTTALDVTVQATVLSLLRQQVDRRGVALLLVSHDLAAVASVADRVAVMYGGSIVETGTTASLLTAPRHPYTAALIASRPSGQRRDRPLRVLQGQVPAASEAPGCAFAPRCAEALPRCAGESPPQVDTPDGWARCWAAVHDREGHG